MSKVDTAAIVRGLDPADWDHIKMLRMLPPAERIRPILEKSEIIRAQTKEKFRHLYHDFNERELNLKVLEYLTGDKIPDKYWEMAHSS
jgi:hypothetical protein